MKLNLNLSQIINLMKKKNINKILSLLKDGLIISLISDAGTPAISDPGSILVNECVKNSIKVLPIPGPSSVTAAMSISGFSEKFLFYGFFPEKKNFRRRFKTFIKFRCMYSIFYFFEKNK